MRKSLSTVLLSLAACLLVDAEDEIVMTAENAEMVLASNVSPAAGNLGTRTPSKTRLD